MAAPIESQQSQATLSATPTPRPVQERYVGGRVSPLRWLSVTMPHISHPARRSLIAATVELIHKFDSYQMLERDEEPDTTRLQNIVFVGLAVVYLGEEDSSNGEGNFDWILDEANLIVGEVCTFIKENLWEVVRPVNAIVDSRRNVSRAEAWILRCSIHPDVVESNENVKAAWRAFLDEYLESSASNWELETDEEESEYSFHCDELIAILSPTPQEPEMLPASIHTVEYISGFPIVPEELEELEELQLAPDVELEPHGPRHKVEDLTELDSSPPKDEVCAICLEAFGGQPDVSACRQLNFCGHFFHEDCIDAWVNGSHAEVVTCPNCRAQICSARVRREKKQWSQNPLLVWSLLRNSSDAERRILPFLLVSRES